MLKLIWILAFMLLTPQTSVAAPKAHSGPKPFVSSTLSDMQKRFRETNQALLALEERAQGIAPERRHRLEPVFDVLEEELGEIASQVGAVNSYPGGPSMSRPNLQKVSVHLDYEVIKGIGQDLQSVASDIDRLSTVIGTPEFY